MKESSSTGLNNSGGGRKEHPEEFMGKQSSNESSSSGGKRKERPEEFMAELSSSGSSSSEGRWKERPEGLITESAVTASKDEMNGVMSSVESSSSLRLDGWTLSPESDSDGR